MIRPSFLALAAAAYLALTVAILVAGQREQWSLWADRVLVALSLLLVLLAHLVTESRRCWACSAKVWVALSAERPTYCGRHKNLGLALPRAEVTHRKAQPAGELHALATGAPLSRALTAGIRNKGET